MTLSLSGPVSRMPAIPGAPNIGGGPELNDSPLPAIAGREQAFPVDLKPGPLKELQMKNEAEAQMIRVAIGSDHGGFKLKGLIKDHLEKQGHFKIEDFGTNSGDPVDYPDIAHPLASSVGSGVFPFGILVCGTGLGMSIAANKVRGVRAAVCHDLFTAEMARRHNNANILVLGERVLGTDFRALQLVDTFFLTGFDGGRHQTRVSKIEP